MFAIYNNVTRGSLINFFCFCFCFAFSFFLFFCISVFLLLLLLFFFLLFPFFYLPTTYCSLVITLLLLLLQLCLLILPLWLFLRNQVGESSKQRNQAAWSTPIKWWLSCFRGAYMTPAVSEVELFGILVPFGLLYVTKSSVLGAVRVLNEFRHFIIIIVVIIIGIIIIIIIIMYWGSSWRSRQVFQPKMLYYAKMGTCPMKNSGMTFTFMWNLESLCIHNLAYTIPLVGHGQGLVHSTCLTWDFLNTYHMFFRETIRVCTTQATNQGNQYASPTTWIWTMNDVGHGKGWDKLFYYYYYYYY